MKHCEKCISYDICNFHQNIIADEFITFFPNNEDCPFFKNKENYEEVKHGKWIPQYNGSFKVTYRCSLCNQILFAYADPSKVPYCHCGAKNTFGKDEEK